jgi:HEAT repeat protein
MARALDALFGRHTVAEDSVEQDRPDPEVETVLGERSDEPAAATALERAVREVLSRSGSGREEAAARVRDLARRLLETHDVESVVEAVVTLVSVPNGEPLDEGDRMLARDLASAEVTNRLADRLGVVRDAERRSELTAAVGHLGRPMAEALAEALVRSEDRRARFAFTGALVRIGAEGADVLAALVSDRRWFVVRNAVLVLGEAGGTWALTHLTRTLAHPDARVRRETLMALARIGGDEAANLVCGMVSDPDPRVRETAALAAGTLGAEAAVQPLLRTIGEGDEPAIEVAVLRALGRLGDDRVVPELERKASGSILSRPTTEVRVAAYRALAAVGTPSARDALRGGLHDRDPEVRAMVAQLMRTR